MGITMGMEHKALAESVGRAIARQRVRCAMTQEYVAEQLGIGNEAVSRIERGLVMPNIARLFEFAALFGCNAAELLDQASISPDGQARHLSRLLETLNTADQQWVVALVEQLSTRLGNAALR